MKIELRPIRTRLDKNRKGETITRIVSSERNESGQPRQKHLLNWGKHPTSDLEKLISKYNEAIQIARKSEIGKIWTRILQLRECYQQRRTATRKWLGKKSVVQEASPYSLFLTAVEDLKPKFEKVLQAEALEKVNRNELPRLQEFLDATQWFAELRTHIKQKVKRMMPQTAHDAPNSWAEFGYRAATLEDRLRRLVEEQPIENWAERTLQSFHVSMNPLAEHHDLAKRILEERGVKPLKSLTEPNM